MTVLSEVKGGGVVVLGEGGKAGLLSAITTDVELLFLMPLGFFPKNLRIPLSNFHARPEGSTLPTGLASQYT
ncbi:hypothetical protein EMIT0P12_110066 [Pseudomonas sp. IT-P12]